MSLTEAIEEKTPAIPGARIVRRRLWAVAVSGFVTQLAFSSILVVLPLYCTRRLGLSSAQFARVMTVRNLGITLGMIVLGVLSDRVGPRRTCLWALALGGVCFAAFGFARGAGVALLIAPLSALLSTAFVNLNHLTQIADPLRPGRANTIYRALGALAGVLGPLVMTRLIDQAEWLFVGVGVLMAGGAAAMGGYALAEPIAPFRGLTREGAAMVAIYPAAFRQRHLMRFIHWSLTYSCLGTVVATFIAIRMTRQLGVAESRFGELSALGAALTLPAILLSGPMLDRVSTKRVLLALYVLSSACLIGLGMSDLAGATAALFVCHTVISGTTGSPLSMWIAAESRPVGLTTGFAVQKVANALYAAGATLAFSAIEPMIGTRRMFLFAGLLGLPVILLMLRLREPAHALKAREAPVAVEEEQAV